MVKIQVRVSGGDRALSKLRRMRNTRSVGSVKAGILNKERYPDGTFVAHVANENEFGNSRIPARPAFRQAAAEIAERVREEIINEIGGHKFGVDTITAERVGHAMLNITRRRIVELRRPPNAASTIRKKKSRNPLIDTRRLHDSLTFRIDER